MVDVLLPPLTKVAQSQFHYVDSTGLTRGVYTGAAETTAYGGDRLAATITLVPAGSQQAVDKAKRAAVLAMLAGLRGRQNRIWMRDHSYQRRGSFPSGELLPNGLMQSATGWSAGSGAIITATDGALRVTLGGSNATPGAVGAATVIPNVPYCVRAFLRAGRGATNPALATFDSAVSAGNNLGVDGLVTVAIVPAAAGLAVSVFGGGSNNWQAGDFFECLYASVSRCALADGGPNMLLHSDTPGGTSWSVSNASVGANGTAGPDGFNDAFYLAETTATGFHFVSQTATVPAATSDFAFSIYVCIPVSVPTPRGWCFLQLTEGTGNTAAFWYFNTSTGALGATNSVGTNWTNLRAFSENCGNGWFRFTIVARKTNAATATTCAFGPATADGTNSYAGASSGAALLTWRGSLSASSVPTRAMQTTTAPAAASNDASGYVYLKGLPPSTSGLLLAGDQVQVGKQLTFVTASLDSNAAGLGYLQVSPPLRYVPADNDPVIVVNPMARFIFTGQFPQWTNVPGVSTTADLDFEEACEP